MSQRQNLKFYPLRNPKSRKATPESTKRRRGFLLAMAILVGMSSLPFFNELITEENGSLSKWLLPPGIQESLLDENSKILGYSKFRVFLYYLLIELYIMVASIGWFSVAKDEAYRYALLLCTASAGYHIFLILSAKRLTWLNDPSWKLWWTLGIGIVLFGLYYWGEHTKRKKLLAVRTTLGSSPEKIISPKVVLSWLAIAFVSTFPYFHDIVTERFVGVKDWVPILGIEDFLTLGERDVWGFVSYRVLLLTLFVQMCAQILWAGWWMDAKYSLYKPFLLVPVGLSMYQITMIVMVKTDAYLNKPDFKLLLVLVFGIILGILYYFKNKALPLNEQESITSVVAQNNNR